jgi:hypothetical protein
LLSPCPGPLAQLAEQRTFNPRVVGSIPTGPTDSEERVKRADGTIAGPHGSRRSSGRRGSRPTQRTALLHGEERLPTLLRSRQPPREPGNTGPSSAPSRTRHACTSSMDQDGKQEGALDLGALWVNYTVTASTPTAAQELFGESPSGPRATTRRCPTRVRRWGRGTASGSSRRRATAPLPASLKRR